MTPPKKAPGNKAAQTASPLLPLRDIVFYPGMNAPLFVGRPKSIKALEKAFSENKSVVLAAQKDAMMNDPAPKDIYQIGCRAEIGQILKMPDGAVKALLTGMERVRITGFVNSGEMFLVNYANLAGGAAQASTAAHSLHKIARTLFQKYIKLNRRLPGDAAGQITGIEDPSQFADAVAATIMLALEDRQEFLEMADVKTRMEKIIEKLQNEIEVGQIERRLQNRVKRQMEKSQRDYYLTEQMKAIQKELGKGPEGEKGEFGELRRRILAAGMSTEVEAKALKELDRLEQMPPLSAEGTVSRNYIDWLLDVPWKQGTKDNLDIAHARKILAEDHYGLEKVKERILEYLAVRKLVERMKGPILCFVGPPGVGKTSLGKSIARAMGRKFVRFSLGGVRDEAEIRGHRRTYIGALPGRIIQSMKKAGTKNPVIMLDEIDKVSSDFRGDPASALLEALDPEQNSAFNDHYLEVDYDLSEVMFITTANSLHTIPRPLLDRMEVIHIPGYTDGEKLAIARKYLLSKQVKEHGLTEQAMAINDGALLKIIQNYTREAGVRNLEREIASICRKVARDIAETTSTKKALSARMKTKTSLGPEKLVDYLGEVKFKDDLAESRDEAGVATGLAWTELGGSILKIETSILAGKGQFILTGKLGEVMKESAQAALSFIRSRSKRFGLPGGFQNKIDIHIHIPEGATPKEGPSAGLTLALAMTSALMNIPVRRDVAMTGEITLRGHALAIGGLREKLLAAGRAGIKTVLIPKENETDLAEVPDNVKEKLTIIPVRNMDEVLKIALVHPIGARAKKKAPPHKPVRKRLRPQRPQPGPPLN
ncbi:MAG: endopeptidase La [Nitrospinae bacterium]|nr:endopeptidase La [Nitrospinota bacterium]